MISGMKLLRGRKNVRQTPITNGHKLACPVPS